MEMEKCDFCGTQLPNGASFCGKCGRVPHKTSHQATMVSDGSSPLRNEIEEQPTIRDGGQLSEENKATVLSHGSFFSREEIEDLLTIRDGGQLSEENKATVLSHGSFFSREEIEEQPTIRDGGQLSEENKATAISHGSLFSRDEIEDQPTINLPGEIEATLLAGPGASTPWEDTPTTLLPPDELASLDEQTDEEDEEPRS
jgi:hypothetical protein